jgi:hypothetical protein
MSWTIAAAVSVSVMFASVPDGPDAGAAAQQAVGTGTEPAAAPPASAAPECDARLKPLAFLTGSWCLSQPKGAVIQEQWMEPRGNSVVAVFRRVLGNGYTPFYEFSQIVAEEKRVVLRQIHVHADFDSDPRRAKPMVLRLVESSDAHAVFEPVEPPEESHSADLQRITYRRIDADTLLLRVESKPPKAEDTKDASKAAKDTAGAAKDAAAKPDPAPAQVLEFRMTRCAS